jgi:CheY-like chemotaxis protein
MMNNRRSSRATVLVVEDMDWILAGMKRSLKVYDYLILEASDDAEAIEIGERIPPDLILTEENLPTLDALVIRLRQHPNLCQVPIVIVNPDEEEGTRYGDINVLPDYALIGRFLAALPSRPSSIQQ